MAKHRVGLQKKVSAIFDGVPIPRSNGAQEPPHAPASEHSTSVPPKSLALSPQVPTTPKPQEHTQSPPGTASTKQPKADTTVKTAKQIPLQKSWQQMRSKLFAPKPGVNATRQKAMAVLVPVLFIVLIFVFVRVFGVSSQKTTKPPSLGLVKAVAGSNNKIDWQIPAVYPTTLRDPMQFGSVITAPGQTGSLIVKGIVYSEDGASAVIGTQIVHEGDKVLGATIVKINKDSVEFEMNNKKWTQKVQR